MLGFRPDLGRALERARAQESEVDPSLLWSTPEGFSTLSRSVTLPRSAHVRRCGEALLSWHVHRLSGLEVAADGGVRAGGTVVLGSRLGPVTAVAPCRVVTVVDEPDRVGFTYLTLPGHPEIGAEEFAFVRVGEGVRFEVRAVSRPSLLVSRIVPWPQVAVQRLLTRRYLDAASAIARGAPS